MFEVQNTLTQQVLFSSLHLAKAQDFYHAARKESFDVRLIEVLLGKGG
jgi:hypothetical protein